MFFLNQFRPNRDLGTTLFFLNIDNILFNFLFIFTTTQDSAFQAILQLPKPPSNLKMKISEFWIQLCGKILEQT